jgi:hypothetical protein
MSLAEPISTVLYEFESTFSCSTLSKAAVLIVGMLLARGRRTVFAALRQMGLHEATNFSLYHHALNRAHRSALAVSRCLLHLLERTFVAGGRPCSALRLSSGWHLSPMAEVIIPFKLPGWLIAQG